MAKLYGSTPKYIRHIHDTGQIEVDAQESLLINFWHTDTSTSASADGTDTDHGENNNGIALPLGSKVTKHRTSLTIEPSTIEPQNIYIAQVQLSFQDIYAPQVCGQDYDLSARQGTVTPDNLADYTNSPLRFYPDATKLKAEWNGAALTGVDIDTWRLNQLTQHYANFKKVTLFDQRPLMGERFQRIPKKCKRANPFTWNGLCIINDSQTTGEVVQVQLQQYLEERQIETPPTTLYT